MWWGEKRVESTRYYYSDDKLFEKSLDVYKPVISSCSDKKQNSSDLPVVLLVVGSGWLGHRALIYAQTSWWNSSGPKTVASLGTTCVCIRHRGAFCVLPSHATIAGFLAIVLALAWDVSGGQWTLALAFTALVAFLVLLLALGGKGSANFEDMLEDVAEALKWIDDNKHVLKIHVGEGQTKALASRASSSSSTPVVDTAHTSVSRSGSDTATVDSSSRLSSFSSDDTDSGSDIELSSPPLSQHPSHDHRRHHPHHSNDLPLVFGGYSSGGHVAATLLQHPEIFKKHHLPPPEKLFQGILIISGVLAVRPEKITIPTGGTKQVIATPEGAPQWLIQLVVRAVWGPEYSKRLPSPLVGAAKTNKQTPSLPHLLVGCRNEMFGLNWLDVFFCSKAYRDMVQATTGQSAKYVEVESDHWNILNSTELKTALQEELPALIHAAPVK